MHPGAIPGRVSPVEISVNGIYAQCLVASNNDEVKTASDFIVLPECITECNITATQIEVGSYGTSGAYGGTYGGDEFQTSLSWIMASCCNSIDEDGELSELGEEWGLDSEPLAFMGNDQNPGVQDACSFWYSAFSTPSIKSFTRVLTSGDALVIEGRGLGFDNMRVFLTPVSSDVGVERWENIYLEVGEPSPPVILPNLLNNPEVYELTVSDRNVTHISAVVPDDIAAGQYMPIVQSPEVGAASYADIELDSQLVLSILPTISSVSPSSLPTAGGFVTITGDGFPVDTSKIVLEGYGAQWHVVSSTITSITAYATNLNQWGTRFTLHIEDLAQHSITCQDDSCPLAVTSEAIVNAGDYRQLSAGSDVTLTLSHSSAIDPDFWAGITNAGAVYVLLDNGLKVYPTITVNGNTALLIISASSLPASPSAGHSGIVMVEGYGVADPGTSDTGLVIQVPVSVSAISSSSGATSAFILLSTIMLCCNILSLQHSESTKLCLWFCT